MDWNQVDMSVYSEVPVSNQCDLGQSEHNINLAGGCED